MLRFSLASLLVVTALAGLGCAAVLNPNEYFAIGLHLLMLLVVLSALFMAIFLRGSRQRLAGGLVVFVIGCQFWSSMFGDDVRLSERLAMTLAPAASAGPYPRYSTAFNPYASSPAWQSYPPNPPTYAPSAGPVNIVVQQSSFDFAALQSIIQSLLLLAAGIVGLCCAAVVSRLEARGSAAPPTRSPNA